MTCIECGNNNFNFDEWLGENICSECGLVEITEPFEQTVSLFSKEGDVIRSVDVPKKIGTGDYPNHIRVGLTYCNLVLSSVANNHPLKNRVEECYLALMQKRLFNNNYPYEIRATALVYYVLLENNLPITLEEVAKEFITDLKKTRRLAKRIAVEFGNTSVFSSLNPRALLEKTLEKIEASPEFRKYAFEVNGEISKILDASDFTKGRTYYAAIAGITSSLYCLEMTNKTIAEKTGFTRDSIYRQTKRILSYFNRNNLREIKGQTINNLIKRNKNE